MHRCSCQQLPSPDAPSQTPHLSFAAAARRASAAVASAACRTEAASAAARAASPRQEAAACRAAAAAAAAASRSVNAASRAASASAARCTAAESSQAAAVAACCEVCAFTCVHVCHVWLESRKKCVYVPPSVWAVPHQRHVTPGWVTHPTRRGGQPQPKPQPNIHIHAHMMHAGCPGNRAACLLVKKSNSTPFTHTRTHSTPDRAPQVPPQPSLAMHTCCFSASAASMRAAASTSTARTRPSASAAAARAASACASSLLSCTSARAACCLLNGSGLRGGPGCAASVCVCAFIWVC